MLFEKSKLNLYLITGLIKNNRKKIENFLLMKNYTLYLIL